jgi:predicted nucleic acid-binding protein
MSGEFVDTNVLVYAHDSTAGRKRDIAAELLLRLSRERSGLVSVQVLVEFYVTVTRKVATPLGHDEALAVVSDLATWNVFAPGAADAIEGMRIAQRHRISPWDAMIVRAAAEQGASVVWSEDLAGGRSYEGVPVRNPFATP